MFSAKIGLIGFGTIGGGVADILIKKRDFWKKTLGIDVELKTIVDTDVTSDRGVDISTVKLSNNYKELIEDSEITTIVELVGGYGFAKDFVIESLKAGKNIVTANKALIATYGDEIYSAAKEGNADLYYDAAVAGGIPIIKAVKESLHANTVTSIHGIINGTCNYILTEMEKNGLSFEKALKQAQDLGFAELDPTFDIEGVDTGHKIAILSSLASWSNVKAGSFFVEGISKITSEDIENAKELGYKIKLLAIYRDLGNDKIEVRVHPTMIPQNSSLAVIDGAFNAVKVIGDSVEELLFTGKGAGRYPTASAVVSDVIDIVKNEEFSAKRRVMPEFESTEISKIIVDKEEFESEYYLKFVTADKVGVISSISSILGENGVSIKSIRQNKPDSCEDSAHVVILTHKTKEGIIQKSMKEFEKLSFLKGETQLIRVEEM